MKENPISNAARRGIGIGGALVLGAVAVYYGVKSPTAASSAASPKLVVATAPGRFSANVGATFAVQLPIGNGVIEYVSTVSGQSVTEAPGTPVIEQTLFLDAWLMKTPGTTTLQYQAINAAAQAVGTPLTFVVTVA